MFDARCLQELGKRLPCIAMEVRNARRLVRDDQRSLAPWILGRDAGGTFVGMAGLGLDASDGEHECARAVAPVSAKGKGAGHVEGGDDLARGADLDAIAQVDAHKCVVHQVQRLAQRRADVIRELYGRRARTPFGAIHDDEIWRDACLEHCLGNGEPFPGMADAHLETDGLAAR